MRTHAPRRASIATGDPTAGRRPGVAGDERADARDVARYIADISGQMEKMAGAAGLDLLAYFLAMARAEAEAISRGSR